MGQNHRGDLWMALGGIAIYVAVVTVCDMASQAAGVLELYTAPAGVAMSVALWLLIKRRQRAAYYGFRPLSTVRWSTVWYGIPLILLASVNLWHGVAVNNSLLEILLYLVSMCCVGFLEEVLFRGLLFRAIAEQNVQAAVVISSVTFGLGHLANLFTGADVLSTLLQLAYATAIGFAFTLFVHKTGNIRPCIYCHAALDALSIFSVEGSATFQTVQSVLVILIAGSYALWLGRGLNQGAMSTA